MTWCMSMFADSFKPVSSFSTIYIESVDAARTLMSVLCEEWKEECNTDEVVQFSGYTARYLGRIVLTYYYNQ